MKGKRHFNTGNKVVGNIYSKKNKLLYTAVVFGDAKVRNLLVVMCR